jgi:hypothetical protein
MELAMLFSFSYWGFHIDKGLFFKIMVGIGTPLIFAIIWGIFIAPKASIPVSTPIRIVLQLILFSCAVFALYVSGKSSLAVIFGIVVVIEMILMYTLDL